MSTKSRFKVVIPPAKVYSDQVDVYFFDPNVQEVSYDRLISSDSQSDHQGKKETSLFAQLARHVIESGRLSSSVGRDQLRKILNNSIGRSRAFSRAFKLAHNEVQEANLADSNRNSPYLETPPPVGSYHDILQDLEELNEDPNKFNVPKSDFHDMIRGNRLDHVRDEDTPSGPRVQLNDSDRGIAEDFLKRAHMDYKRRGSIHAARTFMRKLRKFGDFAPDLDSENAHVDPWSLIMAHLRDSIKKHLEEKNPENPFFGIRNLIDTRTKRALKFQHPDYRSLNKFVQDELYRYSIDGSLARYRGQLIKPDGAVDETDRQEKNPITPEGGGRSIHTMLGRSLSGEQSVIDRHDDRLAHHALTSLFTENIGKHLRPYRQYAGSQYLGNEEDVRHGYINLTGSKHVPSISSILATPEVFRTPEEKELLNGRRVRLVPGLRVTRGAPYRRIAAREMFGKEAGELDRDKSGVLQQGGNTQANRAQATVIPEHNLRFETGTNMTNLMRVNPRLSNITPYKVHSPSDLLEELQGTEDWTDVPSRSLHATATTANPLHDSDYQAAITGGYLPQSGKGAEFGDHEKESHIDFLNDLLHYHHLNGGVKDVLNHLLSTHANKPYAFGRGSAAELASKVDDVPIKDLLDGDDSFSLDEDTPEKVEEKTETIQPESREQKIGKMLHNRISDKIVDVPFGSSELLNRATNGSSRKMPPIETADKMYDPNTNTFHPVLIKATKLLFGKTKRNNSVDSETAKNVDVARHTTLTTLNPRLDYVDSYNQLRNPEDHIIRGDEATRTQVASKLPASVIVDMFHHNMLRKQIVEGLSAPKTDEDAEGPFGIHISMNPDEARSAFHIGAQLGQKALREAVYGLGEVGRTPHPVFRNLLGNRIAATNYGDLSANSAAPAPNATEDGAGRYPSDALHILHPVTGEFMGTLTRGSTYPAEGSWIFTQHHHEHIDPIIPLSDDLSKSVDSIGRFNERAEASAKKIEAAQAQAKEEGKVYEPTDEDNPTPIPNDAFIQQGRNYRYMGGRYIVRNPMSELGSEHDPYGGVSPEVMESQFEAYDPVRAVQGTRTETPQSVIQGVVGNQLWTPQKMKDEPIQDLEPIQGVRRNSATSPIPIILDPETSASKKSGITSHTILDLDKFFSQRYHPWVKAQLVKHGKMSSEDNLPLESYPSTYLAGPVVKAHSITPHTNDDNVDVEWHMPHEHNIDYPEFWGGAITHSRLVPLHAGSGSMLAPTSHSNALLHVVSGTGVNMPESDLRTGISKALLQIGAPHSSARDMSSVGLIHKMPTPGLDPLSIPSEVVSEAMPHDYRSEITDADNMMHGGEHRRLF